MIRKILGACVTPGHLTFGPKLYPESVHPAMLSTVAYHAFPPKSCPTTPKNWCPVVHWPAVNVV